MWTDAAFAGARNHRGNLAFAREVAGDSPSRSVEMREAFQKE